MIISPKSRRGPGANRWVLSAGLWTWDEDGAAFLPGQVFAPPDGKLLDVDEVDGVGLVDYYEETAGSFTVDRKVWDCLGPNKLIKSGGLLSVATNPELDPFPVELTVRPFWP